MQFKRTIFNIDVYGEKFNIQKLNASELMDYQKKLEATKSESGAMDTTLKMLSKQGIPVNLLKSMEIDHLNKLVGAVCGTDLGK